MEVRRLQIFLIGYLWFLLAMTVHEWGHAWVASRFGDDTPRLEGRVTLNPLAHISFLGSVVIPLVVFLFHPKVAVLGWGRPVMVDSNNFKHKKLGDILCSLAGPFLNLAFGLIVLLLGLAIENNHRYFARLCCVGAEVNVALGLFSLIPFPPLDGARVWKVIMGIGEEAFAAFSGMGSFLLIILINLPIFVHYFSEANHFLLNYYWRFCKFLLG